MRKVSIYVDNQLIDLFQDEKIEVKSSVQDIQDIAKVFTDFSQSFTVPASDNNNDIFGFYYNNDLDTFNANTRVNCRIEIDMVPFREGRLQLEGSTVVNNQVQNYKVSFYGDVVTLKDLFADEKLRDLDYSSLSTVYDGATVQASITTTTPLDVRFPLISSSRVWTYNDGSGIDLSGHAIDFTELFPAITDSKLLSIIQADYGVTFQGNFLTDDRFLNSYTWWKNRETTNFTMEAVDMTFNAGDVSCTTDLPDAVGISEVTIEYISPTTLTQPGDWAQWSPVTGVHTLQILFIPATAVVYYIDVYRNGQMINTFSASTSQLFDVTTQTNYYGTNYVYTFKARSAAALTFDFTVKYKFEQDYFTTLSVVDTVENSCNYLTLNTSIAGTMDWSTSAPDIKVGDWFTGLLKQFNLTCYPVDTLTYQIEPLEDWYASGDTVDITQYVDIDTIEIDRAKMYNEISFEWQKSKAFLNVAFEGFNAREYGDLKEVFPNNDGGKYEVKLPFENIMFNNFDTINGNLQVAYCLKDSPDYKPFVPKPVKLYLNEAKDCSFRFDNGSVVEIIEYMPFGQSSQYNAANYSINFGEEIDSLTNNPVSNSLYKTHYQPYLLNLFNSKTRKVTLDDAILIRDKKFRINDMITDLTSGLVKLVLLSDWVEDRGAVTPIPCVTQTGGTVNVALQPPKGGWIDIDDPIEAKFITTVPTIPATNLTGLQTLVITVPVNTSGVDRYQTIEYRGYYANGDLAWTRTIVICQEGSSSFLLTESGGYILQENLDKIKL